MTGVEKLLKAADDSPTTVARRLSKFRQCSRQLVEYWMRCGYVPGTWAPLVNQEFGIALHELNPDVYPKQPVSRAG